MEDVGNVIKELKEVPGEVVDVLIEEYDDLPFVAQVGIGFAPGGDAVDIVKEVRNGKKGEPVDKFVLGLSFFGLIMDLGWADGLIPDPADGGNAAAAFLKALLKQVDEGPTREALETMIKNPDKWDETIESVNVFIKHNDEFKTINNPEMMVWLLEKGPRQVETIATNVAKFGDDASEVVEVFQAGERLAEVGVHSDEASELIDTILDMSVRGDGDRPCNWKIF